MQFPDIQRWRLSAMPMMRKKLIFSMIFLISGAAFGQQKTESNFGSVLHEFEEKQQLESHLKQVRINAWVREEEIRLEQERQARLNPAKVIDPPPLPDLSKAPKWREVEGAAEFQALTSAKQSEVKAAYFEHWIAPHVRASGADVASERSKFLVSTKSAHSFIDKALSLENGLYVSAIALVMSGIYVFRRGLMLIVRRLLNHSKSIALLAVALAVVTVAIRFLIGGPLVIFVR